MTEENKPGDSIVTLSMEGEEVQEEVQEDHSAEAQDYFKESYRSASAPASLLGLKN